MKTKILNFGAVLPAVVFVVSVPFDSAHSFESAVGSSVWKEVLRNPVYEVDMPMEQIRETSFPIHRLCVSGDNLKVETSNCPETAGENHCRGQDSVPFSKPITFTETVCRQWSDEREDRTCLRQEAVTRTIPLVHMVNVYHRGSEGAARSRVAFRKRLDIKPCK